MSNSVQTHRWQPTRLPRPWDSPGKNTGVGCHFLLQCRKVKSESEVTQSCLTLSNLRDCSLPGSFVHGYSRQEYWSGVPLPSLKNVSQFSWGQSLSRVWLFATPSTAAHQASLFITNSWSLLKLMSFESVMSSNHLILCHPLLLLPSVFPNIRVFSNELAVCIQWDLGWPNYRNFSFSISPSNEYSKLTAFSLDRFDLLAVQGTLKSLLQHHDSKHQFFSAQHSSWSSSHICIWL